MITLMILLALLSIVIGTAAVYLALMPKAPIKWLHIHYFTRKPVNVIIFIIVLAMTFKMIIDKSNSIVLAVFPLSLSAVGVFLAFRLHQEKMFDAVNYPKIARNPFNLPLHDDQLLAVIDYNEITKCYPLDYVIHHHIVNDRFGEKLVSLTYCAMCRTIIVFDTTDVGPLFVGSFKNANMIIADQATKTFFQQATFKSVVGKLHPHELEIIPYQLMNWQDVKKTVYPLLVANVNLDDLKEFELPIPGIWQKILLSELTPGLNRNFVDTSMPARERVIGVLDLHIGQTIAYLKKDVVHKKVIHNALGFILVAHCETIMAFRDQIDSYILDIKLEHDILMDIATNTKWNIRGNYIEGRIKKDLIPVTISDEYWFSWRFFHANAQIIK